MPVQVASAQSTGPYRWDGNDHLPHGQEKCDPGCSHWDGSPGSVVGGVHTTDWVSHISTPEGHSSRSTGVCTAITLIQLYSHSRNTTRKGDSPKLYLRTTSSPTFHNKSSGLKANQEASSSRMAFIVSIHVANWSSVRTPPPPPPPPPNPTHPPTPTPHPPPPTPQPVITPILSIGLHLKPQ